MGMGQTSAVQSVTVGQVDDGDLDLFDQVFEQGSAQCGLLLTPEGKVDVAWWNPAEPAPSSQNRYRYTSDTASTS